MIPCLHNKNKPCLSTDTKVVTCPLCQIPHHYGWWHELHGSKAKWTQRFVLDDERAERIAFQVNVIAKAEAEIAKIEAIPSRDDYVKRGE